MSMKILAGLELDGASIAGRSCLNELVTGPLGLLEMLETHLGLLACACSESERVLQFQQCLRECDNGSRFYHRSLELDGPGTAATLLAWRDAWYLHGWDGKGLAATTPRLDDMQAIELRAAGNLTPSVGERLAAVEEALQHRRPPLASICCLEPLGWWPVRWQRVLRQLDAQYRERTFPQDTSTMLGQIQAASVAASRGDRAAALTWVEDGSVHVVAAGTQLLAGQWMAAHLDGTADSTLLIAGQPGMLDDLLAAAGQARAGLGQMSRARPALQLLALALEQVWQPLDVYRLLAFLTHPVCPLPSLVSERLAQALAESPGIGNARWLAALAQLEEIYLARGWDWTGMRARIAFWVEPERFPPAPGAPVAALVERVDALAAFLHGKMAGSDAALAASFGAALQQIRECRQALLPQPGMEASRVSRLQLQMLLQQITGTGTTNPALPREVGSINSVGSPGAVAGPADRVIWWDLVAPPLPASYPWPADEMAALGQAGVQLPPVEHLLERQALAWLRPVLAARSQLILVLPPEGAELHPVWLMIDALFDPAQRPQPQVVEQQLASGGPELQAAGYQPLPEQRRWWQLPPGVTIPRRETESFSSIEQFLFNPSQWVLRYPAALRKGTILGISSDAQLLGSLAHRLVEIYYSQQDALTLPEQQFDAWFAVAFADLIAGEGSTLLLPGNGAELERFRATMLRALKALRRQFAAADIIRVECEPLLQGTFTGGPLSGRADLLLTNSGGKQAVIDMKWAGEKKYAGKMAGNSHLQLALYGELLHQKTGAWPDLAYFILNDAQLLAVSNYFFPGARVIARPKGGEDEGAAHLWQRFLETWKWRRAQLDEGRIEVALTVDEASDAPGSGMVLEALNQRYNDYLALAGWEAEH